MSNHLDDKFDVVVKNLEGRIETYSSDFEQANLRIDEEQRKLIELLLIASIACGDVEQTNTTLIYGRENTFLLRLPKKMLQIVIDLTDEDSFLEGDLQLIRVIIEGHAVLKSDDKLTTLARINTQKSQLNDEASINDSEHKKFSVINSPLKSP